MKRYTFLVLLSCVMLPLVVLAGLEADQHVPATEQNHIMLVSDPGTPPGWAQSPSSVSNSTNQPPAEAAAPGLPGPPSMPLSGLALLTLAGGALAYRRLRSN